MNPAKQEILVPARQVPTANTSGKQDITTEEVPGGAIMNTDASRAVTGDLMDVEMLPHQRLALALIKEDVGLHWSDLEVDPKAAQEILISHHFLCDGVHGYAAFVLSNDLGGIPDVVVVAVSQYKKIDWVVAECLRGPLRCINQDISLWATYQVGVRF